MNSMTFPPQTARQNDMSFLDAASRIGNQLCRDALWHDDRCTWMGWAMTTTDGSVVPAYRTASVSLYDGVAGIALFLGQLAVCAPSLRLNATLEGAIRQTLARVSDLAASGHRGFYTGSLGVAYMLCETGSALARPDWVEQGLSLALSDANPPFADDMLDVIAGCASAIPVLIDLGQRYARTELVDAAINHAQHLLKAGVTDTKGLSWSSQMPKHRNLLGYSHGASGMATALLEAYAASGNEALLQGALEAFRYERSWFDDTRQGWPDFRIDHITPGASSIPPTCNCTWCNGSTGIGLSRLRMMELLPTDTYCATEVNAALQDASRMLMTTTAATSPDLCLCHGLAGVADFVLSAGEQLNRPDVSSHADQVGSFIIENYLKKELPLPCGVQQRGEAPGLLLGTAGVGYFFLRLLDREKTPSVLLLKPAGTASRQ